MKNVILILTILFSIHFCVSANKKKKLILQVTSLQAEVSLNKNIVDSLKNIQAETQAKVISGIKIQIENQNKIDSFVKIQFETQGKIQTLNQIISVNAIKEIRLKDSLSSLYDYIKSKNDSLVTVLKKSKNVNDIVTITYSELIENFKVKVFWLPKRFNNDRTEFRQLIGPAIIEFTNIIDSNVYTLCDINYGVYLEKLSAGFITVHEDESFSIHQKNLNLSYDLKDANKVRANFDYNCHTKSRIKESIIFTDVDYDGDIELLIRSVNRMDLFPDEYFVYECDKYPLNKGLGISEFPYSDCNHYLNIIHDGDEIDHKRKTLLKEYGGPICRSTLVIYDIVKSYKDSKDKQLVEKFAIVEDLDDSWHCNITVDKFKVETKSIIIKDINIDELESFHEKYEKVMNK